MADFYRRTKVEEAGARHAGLLEFVEQSMRDRMPYPQIAEVVLEQWDETLSPQVLSNHYALRVWKKQNAEMQVYLDNLGQGRALLELQKQNPTTEREELISTILDVGIITQKTALMEKDPLKLLAEQRKREEGRGRFKIETGKLEVENKRLELDSQRLAKENRELDLKLRQAEETIGKVREVVSGESGEKADPREVRRRIQDIFGISPDGPAAVSEGAALPGPVDQG
jgi:hypothetical protein